MRIAKIRRDTAETNVTLALNLDGTGESEINIEIGFFDHMLTLFSKHGRFDLNVSCNGDSYVDAHHTVEDIGICLCKAFAQAIGSARGICRYGDITLPMDEALVFCAVDISGRSHLSLSVPLPDKHNGEMDTDLLEEFLLAFTRNAGITVHMRLLDGKNTHHIIEACFKALARSLRAAIAVDKDFSEEIPSTKGMIDI